MVHQHLFTASFENKVYYYCKEIFVESTCIKQEIHFDLGLTILGIAALVYELES